MKKDPTWKCICTISGYHSRCVYDVDWNQNNGLLATASGDDSIKIFGETTSVVKADELNMVMIISLVNKLLRFALHLVCASLMS